MMYHSQMLPETIDIPEDGELPDDVVTLVNPKRLEADNIVTLRGWAALRDQGIVGRLRSMAIVLALMLFVLLRVMPMLGAGMFGALTLVFLCGLIIVNQVQTITVVNPSTGNVEQRHCLGRLVYLRVIAEVSDPIPYAGNDLPPLPHPPSVYAYQLGGQPVVRTALSALWAWGAVEVHAIHVERKSLGKPGSSQYHYIFMPTSSASAGALDQELEQMILALLHNWADRAPQRDLQPWLYGPTYQDVVHTLCNYQPFVPPRQLVRDYLHRLGIDVLDEANLEQVRQFLRNVGANHAIWNVD